MYTDAFFHSWQDIDANGISKEKEKDILVTLGRVSASYFNVNIRNNQIWRGPSYKS
jgi:hypothetical protein